MLVFKIYRRYFTIRSWSISVCSQCKGYLFLFADTHLYLIITLNVYTFTIKIFWDEHWGQLSKIFRIVLKFCNTTDGLHEGCALIIHIFGFYYKQYSFNIYFTLKFFFLHSNAHIHIFILHNQFFKKHLYLLKYTCELFVLFLNCQAFIE